MAAGRFSKGQYVQRQDLTSKIDRDADAGHEADGSIAFIDLEASGLFPNSWPVEVGWAVAHKNIDGAVLIRRAPGWSDDAWDPKAESLHGLSRDFIDANGEPAPAVCQKLNAALAGRQVYADAPAWDGYWLYRLFQAGGCKPAFVLNDFGTLMRPLVGGREAALFDAAEARAPRCHRALPDALHLKALYELSLEMG